MVVVKGLVSEVDMLKGMLSEVKGMLGKMVKRVNDLETEVGSVRAELGEVERQRSELQLKVKTLDEDVTVVFETVESLVKGEIVDSKAKSGGEVSRYRSTEDVWGVQKSYGRSSDDVSSNVGRGESEVWERESVSSNRNMEGNSVYRGFEPAFVTNGVPSVGVCYEFARVGFCSWLRSGF